MFIDPIQLMQFGEGFDTTKKVGGASLTSAAPSQGSGQTLFADIFENAIQDVIDTDNELQQAKYKFATGQTNDPHTGAIASAKAQLAVDMLIQLRNKALDSYNEVMRINL